MNNGRRPFSASIANGIAMVVTLVWAASFAADVLVADYDPNPLIHTIMLAVVGGAVGHSILKNGGRK